MQSLGKSLQRSKHAAQRSKRAKYLGILEAERDATATCELEQQRQRSGAPLKSIWETNNLEEFLLIADAQERGYEAARELHVVVDGTPHIVTNEKVLPLSNDRVDWLKMSELLTIPRRPEWRYEMSAEEVQRLETAAFFDWRRRLAKLEEEHKVVMTPYEKNLEVWRQLWRVTERADVVLMILDARNPLVFRCANFEAYVRETLNRVGKPKEIIFLLNKSDLLTDDQRSAWAAYFKERGEPFIFFSAASAKTQQSSKEGGVEGAEEHNSLADEDEDDDDWSSDEKEHGDCGGKASTLLRNRATKQRHKKKSLRAPVEMANPYELVERRRAEKEMQNLRRQQQRDHGKTPQPPTAEEKARDERVSRLAPMQSWAVLDPEQLLDHLAAWRTTCGISDPETPLMVGLVGYPNVGKSSTINAIFGCKKVVVSATPGKTKHFQTLVIPCERRVALCDCPGLVFPSFASTRAQMVCDGILPIDTATEAESAVAVLCHCIPQQVLEKQFNVSLREEDDVDESSSLAERLLNAVARRRGYLGAHDLPNRSRAAREILKLYVDGALVYVEPPPNYVAPATCAVMCGSTASTSPVTSVVRGKTGADSGKDGDSLAEMRKRKGATVSVSEARDEDWEELASSDENWEDLGSAAEARALSDVSGVLEEMYNDDDDDNNKNNAAAQLTFYVRPKDARGVLSRREAFNAGANEVRVAAAARLPGLRRRKRTNHQLEPIDDTFVNRDGEVELIIDDDDRIIELGGCVPRPNPVTTQQSDKRKSKRQLRRELKRSGAGPTNPTARKMGVQGYNQL